MISKNDLQRYIDDFPEQLSIDELIDRLVFIDKLENRMKESENNEVMTDEDVKLEMKKWFESNG
ncbi:hypothetical protein SAMN05421741_1129 [Paenimyroides ummariense]|uniref:Uncharacterized protein n=1 Tax=Paenimyroides ummariense TaxID=913024 RepID=A0A1I5CAH6_9FLAO|nr:hypothetical protein [Paenimyroides ummariense]SFN83874.1 hypothetical protein SAMN05421741_1129 [Paenimyroides ummariense]